MLKNSYIFIHTSLISIIALFSHVFLGLLKVLSFRHKKRQISNSIGWITIKVREFARGILDGIKSALGIHSPSTVFEQEVGKNMALGVGEGFVNAMNGVKKDMQEAIIPDFDTNLNMLPSSTNSISNIKTTSEVSNSGILGKLDSILSLLEYYIPRLKSRQICLDTGVLVGELTPPINQELAKIQISKERGR